MTEAEQKILGALSDLRVEVSDRLARIETQISADVAQLSLHTAQDAAQFSEINRTLRDIELDRAGARRVSAAEGARAARRWSVAIAVGVAAIAELGRRLWP